MVRSLLVDYFTNVSITPSLKNNQGFINTVVTLGLDSSKTGGGNSDDPFV
jgi:hypothetical protein